MHENKTLRIVSSLAVVAFLWGCEDTPAPDKAMFPLASAPESVTAPEADPAAVMKKPGHRFGKGNPMMMIIEKHADELALSEDQRASIESILDDARADAPMKKGEFKAHMEQMGELIKAESLDESALTVGHDEMQARHREMKIKMFSTFLDTLEVLSVEQRTQLFAIMKDHRGMKGECKGKMGECKGKKGHFKHRGPHGMLLRAIKVMGDDIGQTPEQKESLKTLFKDARAEKSAMKSEKKALHEKMRELMTAPEFDRAAIEAMHTKMLDAKQEKESKRFATTLAALEILTADQRVQVVDTLEQCHPGKGTDGVCKKLFDHKKGKHMHKGHMADQIPAW